MHSTRQLSPDYSFRLTIDDIKTTYGSSETAFLRGDFMIAAQLAAPDSELKACALILSGLAERGLAILERGDCLSERATLCRAFALWSLDRTEDAKAVLDNAQHRGPAERIAKFRELLDRTRVNVFITSALIPMFRGAHPDSILASTFNYGAFTAKYVANQMTGNAYDYRTDEPFDEFIDALPAEERPDLIFAMSPQWLPPKHFEKVDVPKVVWCHDTDVFLYRNIDTFALYDVGICGCSQEHFELSQGAGMFTAANLMWNPTNIPFPVAREAGKKEIDVLFTGSALCHFHSEKPRFMYKLAELGQDYVVRVIDGHLPQNQYFDLLSSAKLLPVVGRHAGAPSPRWRDALTNGCQVIYPQGSFFDEVAPGCSPFSTASIATDIRRHLKRIDENSDTQTSDFAAALNERFGSFQVSREKLFETLLKYVAFLALVWRDRNARPATNHGRRVWLTPGVDVSIYDRETIRERSSTFPGLVDDRTLETMQDYNAASHLVAQMALVFDDDPRVSEWAERADRYLAEGLDHFPNSLLLRFNEAHWEFFRPGGSHERAADKFRAIVDRFSELEFDPKGSDVGFAYTLHDRDAVFPYYEYADVVTTELVLRNTPELADRKHVAQRPKDILLYACYGYIGWSLLKRGRRVEGLAHIEKAFAIFPGGIPLLRLYIDTLLQGLIRNKKRFDRKRATKLADAFFLAANINPTILLTHIFAVVPLLIEGGDRDAAKTLLAGWYRLGNIVYAARMENNRFLHIDGFMLLYHFQWALPPTLIQRVRTARGDVQKEEKLTQFEQMMLRAVLTYKRSNVDRWLKSRDFITLGHYPQFDPTKLASLAYAFFLWCKLPYRTKLRYAYKFWIWTRAAGVKVAYLRMRSWAAVSTWANRMPLSIQS